MSENFKSQLSNLATQGEIEKALALCLRAFKNRELSEEEASLQLEIQMISGNYQDARQAHEQGLSTKEEFQTQKSKARGPLLRLIPKLPEDFKLPAGEAEHEPAEAPHLALLKRRYNCNRREQEEMFEEIFQTRREQKLQFYFIHGEKAQSPEGLFRRLVYRYIQQVAREGNYVERVIPIDSFRKNRLLSKLFQAFALNPNRLDPQSFNLRKLLEAPSVKGRDYVAIKIKVYSNNWDEEDTPKALKWFVQEFCQQDLLPEHAPKLVFFFGLVHKEDLQKEGIFKRLFKGSSKKERILKAISELEEITVFPALNAVTRADIEFWFEENFEWDSREIQQILQAHFPKAKEYPMDEVIEKLGAIIKAHNDKIVPYQV